MIKALQISLLLVVLSSCASVDANKFEKKDYTKGVIADCESSLKLEGTLFVGSCAPSDKGCIPAAKAVYKYSLSAKVDPGVFSFPRQVGINKGNFVEMVAKKYFEEQGYNVEIYYYLVRNKNKRERMPGFKKICCIFSEEKVRLLIDEADKAFRSIGKKIASGDPDLFVYNGSTGDRFFVEVKENDQVTDNQKVLFPLIEKFLCPVFIARVIAKKPSYWL